MEEINDTLVCLTIGDPHFKTVNTSHSDEFVKNSLQFIDDNLDLIDIIIILGDVHDKHKLTHIYISTAVSDYFRQLQQRKPLFILVGNHDRQNNQDHLSNIHPFNDMKLWNNTYIVDQILEVNIKGHRVIMTPYVYPGRFNEALNEIGNPLDNTSVIFAHQEIEGVKMGAYDSVEGDKWLPEYPWLISGHIHDYWTNNNNIVYTGTPMQHGFADSVDKTISLFTIPHISTELPTSSDTFTMIEELPPLQTIVSQKGIIDSIRARYDYYLCRGNQGLSFNQVPLYQNILRLPQSKIIKVALEETRIDLKLTKRRLLKIPADRALQFVPDKNYLEKVIIVGTFGECKALKELDYIKQLEKQVCKLDYKYIDNNQEIVDSLTATDNTRISYLDSLQQAVSEQPRKERLLREIIQTVA